MMSIDIPKIGLPSYRTARVIKGIPDKKCQEEENLVYVALPESFLNGVRWQRSGRFGRSCRPVTHD